MKKSQLFISSLLFIIFLGFLCLNANAYKKKHKKKRKYKTTHVVKKDTALHVIKEPGVYDKHIFDSIKEEKMKQKQEFIKSQNPRRCQRGRAEHVGRRAAHGRRGKNW